MCWTCWHKQNSHIPPPPVTKASHLSWQFLCEGIHGFWMAWSFLPWPAPANVAVSDKMNYYLICVSSSFVSSITIQKRKIYTTENDRMPKKTKEHVRHKKRNKRSREEANRKDWLPFGVSRYFQQYFSYIMENSFSGGRSRSPRREPSTMDKQRVNFITCGCESSAPVFVIYKAGRQPTPYWW